MKTINDVEILRINRDVNGNPRCVFHFLALITEKDRIEANKNTKDIFGVESLYQIALKKSRQIGGKRYHHKNFGGGIVVQAYSVRETIELINRVLESEVN